MFALDDLNWPRAAERFAAGAVLVVPLGSTEQHGPHLPLSTDTDVALALCRGLARQRSDVLVAPPLAYGASGEHAGFPGTLSIGTEALTLVLLELGRSAGEFAGHLLIVSAHGGNAEAVTRAVARLRYEGRDVSAFFASWTGDAHAGRAETSMQLALDGRRVALGDAAAGNTTPLPELLPTLRSAGVRAVSANGVLGDPSGASAEEGIELLGEIGAELLAHVAGWRTEVSA